MPGFFRRKPFERTGFELYTESVRAARQPWFYTGLGVPDTLDGRFDMVGLHVVLLIDRLTRLPPPGKTISQAVFDAMFADMDYTLREMGVGDMSVGRRVKAMWEALHGRATAYVAAIGDPAALEAALARNVWRGAPPPQGSAAALARYAQAQHAALEQQGVGQFDEGRVAFAPILGTAA